MEYELGAHIKKLSLSRGDILVVQKGFTDTAPGWTAALQSAGKTAGIDFEVPVIFVDDVDQLAVVKVSKNG